MKLFLILLAIAATEAAENYNGPEWAPIDWTKVVYPHEVPGFWDDKPELFKEFSKVGRGSRIVGGQEAAPNAHPYQVALLLTVSETMAFLCGGSVIRTSTILTAAHCIEDTLSGIVIAGAHNMNQIELNQQRRTVPGSNFRMHPNYNNQNLNNDLATILITNGALTLTNYVQVIQLPRGAMGSESFAGERGTSTGWGLTSDGGNPSSTLRYVVNDIITNAACAYYYGSVVVNANKICIETVGGRGTCQGDSGGVLSVLRNGTRVQVGITSFGAFSCVAGYPAGFERVSSHLSWIDANSL